MKKIYLIFLGLAYLSCQSTNEAPQLRWKSAELGSVFIESIYPVFFEDKIIVSQSQEKTPIKIYALNKSTGQSEWLFQDTASENASLYYNLKPYTYQEILLIPVSNRLLAISMRTGKLLWENKLHDAAEAYIEGLDAQAFRFYYDYTSKKAILYKINVLTGKCDPIWSLPTPQNGKLFCRTPLPFINANGDTNMVFSSIAQTFSTRETTAKIHWLSSNFQHSDSIIYPPNFSGDGVTKQPLLNARTMTLFLVANQDLIAVDISTRREKWRKTMPRDMLTSALQMDKKNLFFPAEDGFLYALDQKNGTVCWKADVSGTPSRIYLTSNAIHVIGGGDGLWHILNKSTGESLLTISTPNEAKYPGISFRRVFGVSPDGKSALTTDGKDFFYYIL